MEEETKVRVGYACLNLSLEDSFKNFRLATVQKKDQEKIIQVIWHNIRLLRAIIEYNIAHNIYVYRISSDLVPFCTQPYIKEIYEESVLNNEEMYHHFTWIRSMQQKYNLRLSIHPSQFNVLSSPKADVVARSVEEINTQAQWVKMLYGENVVIHVGGCYGDKKAALQRFNENLSYVDQNLITIENDDKSYDVQDVVSLCEKKCLKWVYDYHHDRCFPTLSASSLELVKHYPPSKYHLSTGSPSCHSRPHAEYISSQDYYFFVEFLKRAGIKTADVIFEAKQKNLAIEKILEPIGDGFWQLKEIQNKSH